MHHHCLSGQKNAMMEVRARLTGIRNLHDKQPMWSLNWNHVAWERMFVGSDTMQHHSCTLLAVSSSSRGLYKVKCLFNSERLTIVTSDCWLASSMGTSLAFCIRMLGYCVRCPSAVWLIRSGLMTQGSAFCCMIHHAWELRPDKVQATISRAG